MDRLDFARLENTAHGQCLVTIDRHEDSEGNEGPAIKIRIAEICGMVPECTLGPWPDTEESWKEVQQKMADMDMEFVAGELARSVMQLAGKT